MGKILQSTGRARSVTVTNDGATILKSLHIDNPAAKVLVDISKVQMMKLVMEQLLSLFWLESFEGGREVG
ncbi:hypothetical protein PVAP13_5NG156381 [Panicum virgatum]|uniref:Uncharacterized protein n=1 Tax=Panicum virgatum TaxID=38727 RepID=A0A8T0RMW7_PANVG|nr:hypothetical protein PVAP13_5NG156381 [Panicum virgatum]